jgi:hypothetical protein
VYLEAPADLSVASGRCLIPNLEDLMISSDQNDDDPPPQAADAAIPTPDAADGLTDAHHDWVQQFTGIDPRRTASLPEDAAVPEVGPDASSIQMAMGAPSPAPPDPGLLEEVEEAAKSGVRAIGRLGGEAVETAEEAAVAVGEGVAAGAVAVGAAVGAAILLWSTPTAPPWMDEINPETGKSYASEEEYNRVKASKRDHRHIAQPLPPPVPGVDYDDAPPQAPTCANQFPGVPRCNPNWLGSRFDTLDQALEAQPAHRQVAKVNTTTMADYQGHPDGKNNHKTYYNNAGQKLFTLMRTPCCEDTPAGPTLTWRWSSDE